MDKLLDLRMIKLGLALSLTRVERPEFPKLASLVSSEVGVTLLGASYLGLRTCPWGRIKFYPRGPPSKGHSSATTNLLDLGFVALESL
jgi:hypothetical protein